MAGLARFDSLVAAAAAARQILPLKEQVNSVPSETKQMPETHKAIQAFTDAEVYITQCLIMMLMVLAMRYGVMGDRKNVPEPACLV